MLRMSRGRSEQLAGKCRSRWHKKSHWLKKSHWTFWKFIFFFTPQHVSFLLDLKLKKNCFVGKSLRATIFRSNSEYFSHIRQLEPILNQTPLFQTEILLCSRRVVEGFLDTREQTRLNSVQWFSRYRVKDGGWGRPFVLLLLCAQY